MADSAIIYSRALVKNCQRARATCLATVYLEKANLYTFVYICLELGRELPQR